MGAGHEYIAEAGRGAVLPVAARAAGRRDVGLRHVVHHHPVALKRRPRAASTRAPAQQQ
jgi:hypothetical protein